MKELQIIVFQLLIQKMAEQQTDIAEMNQIHKNWMSLNKSDSPLQVEKQKYQEALRRYNAVTNEINGLTRALNESL